MQIQPYLFFNGRCEEALSFYSDALGAKVAMMLRYKDSPEKLPPGALAPDWENKIMHANLRVGEAVLLASDGHGPEGPSFESFGLALSAKDEAEAEKIFTALGQGGEVRMPMAKTFFSSGFGMVSDRFGVLWMVMVAADKDIAEPKDFAITRVFDAPRDVVWKAWTETERLAQWWGPKGFGIRVAKLDLRPGGVFHYVMKAGDGPEMWGKFVYRDVAAPESIVFVSSFSDEQGGLTRHPMCAKWPLEVINVLTFEEAGGKTRVTLRGGPLNASDEEREAFEGARDMMRQGFGGTFDQLADYLARQ